MTEKFEYEMRCFDGLTSAAILENLNKMGQEGWELISDINCLQCTGINTSLPMFIFKRSYAEFTIINESYE